MASPESTQDQAADIVVVERGVAVPAAALDAAVDEIGQTVPPAQLRALLVVDRIGRPSLGQLATALGTSASATSRLCDRMQTAGLLERAAGGDRRGITLGLSTSGQRLADWVGEQRRAALLRVLEGMSPGGRVALEAGLRELRPTPLPRPDGLPPT